MGVGTAKASAGNRGEGAREDQRESITLATITFRISSAFNKLASMTGTAVTEAEKLNL